MLTHKQCPKCKGNMYKSTDYYGSYEQCLQCGYTYDVEALQVKKQTNQLKQKSSL